jgi:hypothetical protein
MIYTVKKKNGYISKTTEAVINTTGKTVLILCEGVSNLDELKPCPFCGSKAKLVGECDMVWARCSNHDCQAERITRFDEPEDAIGEWNNRISPLII